ncbi:MAG: HPF/RaiA family ribosome-associated protein [Acidobacteriia bacterium]|nr:HPF/RaiA family ribosome-associated protein [Terriglobia bacterium]
MKSKMQITFRNMKRSQAVEGWIASEVAKLETFYNRLMGCRVTVEVPHRHHKRGWPYHIRVDLTVPGGEIVVKREPSLIARSRRLGERASKKQSEVHIPHKKLRQAIDDAFKAAGRRLQDYARRQRGDIKSPSTLPEARVSSILPREGFGFLTSDDGREIYFHKNSVLGRAFPRLKVGTAVRFVEEAGEEGPQASTVRILARRGTQENAKVTAA